jgi:RNA polymerase sigma factor (sigma-70 family)
MTTTYDSQHGEAPQPDWPKLIAAARNGNADALDELVARAQTPIYNLALRMLKRIPDAEDATQEILVRIITHLGEFRGDSTFLTWAYRIAGNHLLNTVTRDKHRQAITFGDLADNLKRGLAAPDEVASDVSDALFVEDIKRSCTLGMVLCLGPEDRLALILGDLFDVGGDDGAFIMGVTPGTFRQRLSRACKTIVAFVAANCGIVNPATPCRCSKQAARAAQAGQLHRDTLAYAGQSDANSRENDVRALSAHLNNAARAAALMRAHPRYQSRVDYVEALRQLYGEHKNNL